MHNNSIQNLALFCVVLATGDIPRCLGNGRALPHHAQKYVSNRCRVSMDEPKGTRVEQHSPNTQDPCTVANMNAGGARLSRINSHKKFVDAHILGVRNKQCMQQGWVLSEVDTKSEQTI